MLTSRRLAYIAATAVIYTLLARVGLLLDPVGGFATVVWAPTGIAIAALLLGGYTVAVGVLAGAFAANFLSGAPAPVAAVIAVGNTLEAVVALALLRGVARFDARLHTIHDVVLFASAAVVVAPVVSATVGVMALRVAGMLPPEEIGHAWRAWWVGDAIGALIVAPFVLVWQWQGIRDVRPRLLEAIAMLTASALVSGFVFFAPALRGSAFLQAYLVFPVLLWAAIRFTQRGAVTAVLLTGIIAVAGTAQGSGPFVQSRLQDSLFALQTFMGIVAFSFLVVGTALQERERALAAGSAALTAVAEANRAKSDFLATMSHELRTPLNAISGYAQLLAMDVHGPLTAPQRDAITRIETNQRHLAALVDDVLSFTRVEGGRLELNAVAVQVSSLFEALPAFVDGEARRRNVIVSFAPVDDRLTVRADPDRLRQVMLNLVINGIKYTNAGGHVEVRADREEDRVRITVTDTGIGISAEHLARVFEPFFQVEQGKTRRTTGVGLGLTISRDLARAMGGDLTLASRQGQGTIATLTLAAG